MRGWLILLLVFLGMMWFLVWEQVSAGQMHWFEPCGRNPEHRRMFIEVDAIILIAPTRKLGCTYVELVNGRKETVKGHVNEVICKKHGCD